MPFNPPNQPNLLPLLLQFTMQQRAREEGRVEREEALKRAEEEQRMQRSDSALSQGLSLLSQGMDVKSLLPLLRQRGLGAEAEPFLEGFGKTLKQQQKAAELSAQSPEIAALTSGRTTEFGGVQGPTPEQEQLLEGFRQFGLGALESPEADEAFDMRLGLEQAKAARAVEAKAQKRRETILSAPEVTFFDPENGEPAGAASRGSQQHLDAIKRGLIPTSTAVQAATPEAIFGDKVLQREAITEAADAVQRGQSFESALRTVNEASPKAFGTRAALARTIGGVLMQLTGDPESRKQISADITDSSPEALDRLFVMLENMGAVSVGVFTGEGTTRISDKELGISKKALGAKGPTANQTQLRTAFQYLIGVETANEHAALIRANRQPRFRLVGRKKDGALIDNPKEVDRLEAALVRRGLTPEAASEVTTVMLHSQQQLMEQGFLPTQDETARKRRTLY